MRMRRTALWYRVVLWVLTVAMAAFILSLSLQPATQSDTLSTSLTHEVLSCFPSYRELPLPQQEAVRLSVNDILRAIAHIAEFTLLGFFLSLLCHSYLPRRWFALSFPIGAVFAVADECVQKFCAPGRAMQFVDLLKDWMGGLLGALFAFLIICFIRRRHKRRRSC